VANFLITEGLSAPQKELCTVKLVGGEMGVELVNKPSSYGTVTNCHHDVNALFVCFAAMQLDVKGVPFWSAWTYIMIILSSLEAECRNIFPPLSVVTSLGWRVATLPTPKRKRGERERQRRHGELERSIPLGVGVAGGVRQCDVTSTVSSCGTFLPFLDSLGTTQVHYPYHAVA
jgi:hypothetical protein